MLAQQAAKFCAPLFSRRVHQRILATLVEHLSKESHALLLPQPSCALNTCWLFMPNVTNIKIDLT
jgi:hypothetical protein